MAVSEARAAWQRTVNRCLVQEDAKRAPKLASCPAVSPSVSEADLGPRIASDAKDIPSVGFLPFSQNTSYSNLSPNSRWWLQLQPSYRHQRGLTGEQFISEESSMKISQSGLSSASKLPDDAEDGAFVHNSMDVESFVDSDLRISSSSEKNDFEAGKLELKPLCKQNPECFSEVEDSEPLLESAEIPADGYAASKKENDLFPYSESRWIGDEKTEPWWRIADQDELAVLVAQRSFGFIENCDLPQPQNSCGNREAFVDLCSIDRAGNCILSTDPKHPGCCHGLITRNRSSVASEGECRKQWLPVDRHSSTITAVRESTNQGAQPMRSMSESDSSKAELLEALRHSQTRAREAEKAAKQAYEEKEHVVKLVFRQASQLFAYKQWFQLLQLENLCYQIKNNKNQPISMFFPVALPWMPQKPKKSSRKDWHKYSRGKRAKKERPRGEICRYAVAFALGLSLVGAGLLLGWTAGWMLPTL